MLKWEYDSCGSDYGADERSCEKGNKSSGFIMGWGYPD
jgi:hypothetical protein